MGFWEGGRELLEALNSRRFRRRRTAMEPSFPKAAEMPWHVQRYAVGKISAGI